MFKLKHLVAVLATVAAASASAVPVFAGSWSVDQGPGWPTGPAAYTGQEAAALLFGGAASDYVISTVDSSVANIDDLTWVSTWGGACGGVSPCGTKVAESFKVSTGGFYLTPGDTSAYVNDWAFGAQFTNYAFNVAAIPEPETYALMLAGLAAVGAVARRRKQAV